MAKKELSRQKKVDTRIDFTPMVDMNMLLITFFMLCTTMIKSQTLQIALPSNEKVDQQEQDMVNTNNAITIIVDGKISQDFKKTEISKSADGKIYYYTGLPFGDEQAVNNASARVQEKNNLQEFKRGEGEGSMRLLLKKENKAVLEEIDKYKTQWKKGEINDSVYQEKVKEAKENKELKQTVVMIKATNEASYADVVNALDEMQITQISRFQIEHLNAADSALLEQKGVNLKDRPVSNKFAAPKREAPKE